MRTYVVMRLCLALSIVVISYQISFSQSSIAPQYNQKESQLDEDELTSEEYFWLVIDHISFLTDMAEKYYYKGNLNESIRLQEEALGVICQHFDNKEYIYYANLNKLADYYSYNDDPNMAIKLGEDAIKLMIEDKGENSIEYAFALTSLANYYCDLGNYYRAIELGEKAIKIKKGLRLENDFSCAISLNNLSKYYSLIKDYSTSVSLITQSLKIRESLYGKEDPYYASSLNNLAVIYSYLGNYDAALNAIQETLDLKKSFFSDFSFDYINTLVNIASIYYESGDINKSLNIYDDILNTYPRKFLQKYPGYFNILWNLSSIYDIRGDLSKIKSISNEISECILSHIRDRFLHLPLKEREIYWSSRKLWSDTRLLKFSWKYGSNELSKLSYNASLLSKGIILNSEKEFEKFIAENGSKEVIRKNNIIKQIKNRLDELYKEHYKEQFWEIDSLERYSSELERQLMRESAEYGDYTRNLSITWTDVRDKLKEKDTAIEFVSFPLNDNRTMYMAYILRPEVEAPILVKLFEEKELLHLTDKEVYSTAKASSLIWEKLLPELGGVKNIYFAPAGILHQIAIEYLPDFEYDGLISDRYNMYRLSSTRELALSKPKLLCNNAVVYGGIKYDTEIETMESESAKYQTRGFSSSNINVDSLPTRSRYEYLKFTLSEAETIDSIMRTSNLNGVLISGDNATEESFKSLSGSHKNVIHIATHGFYWEKDEAEYRASKNSMLSFMSELTTPYKRDFEDLALIRTGLLMAGANNILRGKVIPKNIDDGILTAKEIANLDFRDLDMVVLSACQTGMGDISGDGVFGLQRGFKKAGANSILMSLWDVDDKATQILMTEFYKNYLNGKSKRESLLAAQKVVREISGFEAPEYWAAFILLDGIN